MRRKKKRRREKEERKMEREEEEWEQGLGLCGKRTKKRVGVRVEEGSFVILNL